MEGSSYNKNVANYEYLSKYYDYLLQDPDWYLDFPYVNNSFPCHFLG